MPLINQNVSLPTAVDTKSHFDLSSDSFASLKFFTPVVTYSRELVPRQSIDIRDKTFIRTIPLVKPMVADIVIHNRYFFVPYRTCFSLWDNALTEINAKRTEQASASTIKLPVIRLSTFKMYFTSVSTATTESVPVDFRDLNAGYILSDEGRKLWYILQGLGYKFKFDIPESSLTNLKYAVSALPLLAFARVYYDYFYQKQFATQDAYNLEYILRKYDYDSNFELNTSEIATIFNLIKRTFFERDYFTMATINPLDNGGYSTKSTNMKDPTSATVVQNGVGVVPNISTTEGVEGGITKGAIEVVNALTDLKRRYQLSGVDAFNRILSVYGVQSQFEKTLRSVYIGDCPVRLDISDVTNMSYADDTALGELAGKGIGYDEKGHIRYSTNEYGMLICVSIVVPKFHYMRGAARHTLVHEIEDMWNPNYEHLGVEPVFAIEENGETYRGLGANVLPDRVFGYVPRYASYKVGHDFIVGDLSAGSKEVTYEPWFIRKTADRDQSISSNFIVADPSKVNHPFIDNSDPILMFTRHHIKSIAPMHPLFEEYQWSNEDENPTHVTIANQGQSFT